jgi:hypothetical protein
MLNAFAIWSPMTVTVNVEKLGTWKLVFTFAVSESPGCIVADPEMSVTFAGEVALKWFVEAP